jgi:IS605 OrfB family transposase
MKIRIRSISPPFVVAPPAGARVRTRLRASVTDAQVLAALGTHLGSLAGGDLAHRCKEGRLDAKGKATSRATRKRSLTAASSSRWAGAITRTSEDAFQLGYRNLIAERRSLRARIARIKRRLAVPCGERQGRLCGYSSKAERYQKQRRLSVLNHRLNAVETRLEDGRVSFCRGGRALARAQHHLDDTGLTEDSWQDHWRAARLFICADGEAEKTWGNETIRFHPDEGWVEVKLPGSLAHFANLPHGRYRLTCPVAFSYRADEVAAQAASGAMRYDVIFDEDKSRWYLDASWKCAPEEVTTIDALRSHRVLAIDVNAGHLAAMVVDPFGNPVGPPVTVGLDLAGLASPTRDGHLRAGISSLIRLAKAHGAKAVVIEDLDFDQARSEGREHTGSRPSRGRQGKAFRHVVSGIPTAKFRDRLVQMASNAGLSVIAVDPAYTSKWGAGHWLRALKQISSDATGHHAAALVIGRRGLGQRARRREGCASTRPEDRRERATNSAVWPVPTGETVGLSEPVPREPGTRQARGQPQRWQKTRPAERPPSGDQVVQDRSGPPTRRDSVPLSVQER